MRKSVRYGVFVAAGFAAIAGQASGQCEGRWIAGPSPAFDGPVYAMTVHNGELIVGGTFTGVGGVTATNIAAWDGSSWRALGEGLPHAGMFQTSPRTLVSHEGDLYAGGRFRATETRADTTIARWDGSTWHALPAWSANQWVSALAVHEGRLHAAGLQMFPPGHVTTAVFVSWDGMAFTGLGRGVDGPFIADAFALTSFGGSLIAGGIFNGKLARWNGVDWVRDIGVVTGGSTVWDLTVYNGELIMCGNFTTVDGVAMSRIARWDGTTWGPLGTGLSPGSAAALAVFNGDLIAAGEFTMAGGQPVNRIARWDGSMWRPMGAGVDHTVFALQVYGDELLVGGTFQTAGGEASPYWARWTCAAPCPIDYTGDGIVDFADYLEFLNRFDSQDPSADLNGDGIVDFSDYLEFLTLFDGGC